MDNYKILQNINFNLTCLRFLISWGFIYIVADKKINKGLLNIIDYITLIICALVLIIGFYL